ncbi:11376_t:CDS:1, partial [Racocetra persica]
MSLRSVMSVDDVNSEINFEDEKYKNKAKAGRLKIFKYLKDNGANCCIFDQVIGPSIFGKYGSVPFFVMVRYWSKNNTRNIDDKYDEYCNDYRENFPDNFTKFYFCPPDETPYIKYKNIHFNSECDEGFEYYVQNEDDLLDLLILENDNQQVLSQNSSVSAPSQERNQDNIITDSFKNLASFEYCISVTYKMRFDPSENDIIDYRGFDYFGKRNQQYFAIRDERNHNVQNEADMRTHLNDFNRIFNTIFNNED